MLCSCRTSSEGDKVTSNVRSFSLQRPQIKYLGRPGCCSVPRIISIVSAKVVASRTLFTPVFFVCVQPAAVMCRPGAVQGVTIWILSFLSHQLGHTNSIGRPKQLRFSFQLECLNMHGERGKNCASLHLSLCMYLNINYKPKISEAGHSTELKKRPIKPVNLPSIKNLTKYKIMKFSFL